MGYDRPGDAAHAAPGLTPERHADPRANVVAARNQLGRVLEIITEEPFEPPRGCIGGHACSNTTVQRELACRRASGGADDVDPCAAGEVEPLVRGARPHRFHDIEIGVEEEHMPATLAQVRQAEARLERHRPAHETYAHIDGRPCLKRSAARRAAAPDVTECSSEIDAKLVLGATATTAGCTALGDRHLRERHQRDSRQKTTCDLPHIKPPVGVVKTATSLRTTRVSVN